MRLVIAGDFLFPEGSASASRIRHMAKGLAQLGHDAYVVTTVPQKASCNMESNIWHTLEGYYYYVAGPTISSRSGQSYVGKIKEYYSAFRRGLYSGISCIEELNEKKKVDVLIGYSYRYFCMHQLINYCRKRGILVVRDVVEWFDPAYFRMGRLNPLYWDREFNMHLSLPKSDGIIAISRFIAEWFSARKMKVIRIPAIIDPDLFTVNCKKKTDYCNDVFQLTYLGGMIERDGPILMMKAVNEVLKSGLQIFFNIIGSEGNEGAALKAKQYAETKPLLKKQMKFWGRVPQQKLIEMLSCSDALVFTRLDSRDAKATFPTRLPEYLMTGKPVITSRVSDIAEYLVDDKEAVIVTPNSSNALAEGIRKLVKMPDRGEKIGVEGMKKCKQYFDYRIRCKDISDFIEDLLHNY